MASLNASLESSTNIITRLEADLEMQSKAFAGRLTNNHFNANANAHHVDKDIGGLAELLLGDNNNNNNNNNVNYNNSNNYNNITLNMNMTLTHAVQSKVSPGISSMNYDNNNTNNGNTNNNNSHNNMIAFLQRDRDKYKEKLTQV